MSKPEGKNYGVIMEWKDERSLIMESIPMTYEEALKRMKDAIGCPRVIRAAVFQMLPISGNTSIIPTEGE